MHHKKRLGLAVSTALGLTAIMSIPVCAQDAQTDDEFEMEIEEVVVTGSRISNIDGFARTSPVVVLGMDEISSFGLTRVEDVLNNLPQIEASNTSFDANGATGTASIDLRGLGSHRTLVLLNGRRMQPGGIFTESVDVNQIPAAMIERVEVLTGGASATYGADAVAGVVNFIMRRVDGVEVSTGMSGYQHNNDNDYIQGLMDQLGYTYPTGSTGLDGKAYNFDIVIGGDIADGRGNATAFVSWRKNNELIQAARDYSSCALSREGDWCGGSINTDVPNFFIAPLTTDGEGPYGYDFAQEEFLSLQTDSSLVPWTGNRYNFAPINHFQRPDERWSAGAFVDYEINQHAIPYLEVMFAYDETRGQIAESGTFFAEVYPLPLSNALFPDNFEASLREYFPGEDELGIYIGKRNVEGGPRTDLLQHNSYRVVAGVKGVISNNWDYDVSYLHAQTASSSTYENDFLAPKIFTAVNAELCAADPGCIPYEVFTYEGVTPRAAASIGGTAISANRTFTDVFSAYATGTLPWGLPAGEIMVVAGYEWRQQGYQTVSDILYEEGLLLGQSGVTPSLDGIYRVNELFAEANVPLLSDKSWAQRMTLDLAYRWSDYSTSVTTNTYRVGLDWQVFDALRLRTGYNRAVRTPNIGELFFPQELGGWFGVDPCEGEAPVYTAAQCALTGVTAEQYGNIQVSPFDFYNGMYGGNPDLDPEKAKTFTFGMIIDPMDNMQVSIDFWDIKIEDVIGNIVPETTIEQCALFGNLCENIQRSGSGSLWAGRQSWVWAANINIGEQHWQGIDLAWTWLLDAWGGNWNFDLLGTYTLKKETTQVANDPQTAFDCQGVISFECYPNPKWRHIASATYDSNSFWVVTARWRYYGKVEYEGTLDLIANDNLGAQNYIDLNAVFRFMDNHDVVIGVNNVFDKEPPIMGGTLSFTANTVAGFYDSLGRYLFANVTLRW